MCKGKIFEAIKRFVAFDLDSTKFYYMGKPRIVYRTFEIYEKVHGRSIYT